jgi:hypothetical protein
MAEHGVFVGWSEIVPGRERQSRRVFGEALAFMAEQEQAGNIESHEVTLLGAHGGDLQGFMLMRGDLDKLNGVITSPEWQRLVVRAGYIVQGFGVVRALLDDEAVRWVQAMEEVTADLE